MKVSITIPCYEMYDYGDQHLDHALKSIIQQTYQNIEVIISDHSCNDKVKKITKKYESIVDIKYLQYENKRGSSSANINNCIRHASGDIIKILFQDDYLYNKQAIANIVKEFDHNTYWLVTSFYFTYDKKRLVKRFDPHLSNNILISNTLGPPSGLSMINQDPIYFDEDLIWWMDTDYYKRLYDKFGLPKLIAKPTFVTLLWDGQVSNTLAKSQDLREAEAEYLLWNKHLNLPMCLPNGIEKYEPKSYDYQIRVTAREIYHFLKNSFSVNLESIFY